MTRKISFTGTVALGIAVTLAAAFAVPLGRTSAKQNSSAGIRIKNNDIGGTVISSNGPEAGVWVIAETNDLPTHYIKEVVTDDRGRYLIPDLPKAEYSVWARGYGLVDSPKVQTEPGKLVDLKPSVAPDARAAAQYYPANYWYSLLNVPGENEFHGADTAASGISPNVKSQGEWIHLIKTDACESCHQLGNQYTRTIPAMFSDLDPAQAWMRRVQSGQAGAIMMGGLSQLGPKRATELFGDWTTRIAKGELPAEVPPRPQGVERNVRDHAVGLGRSEGISARRNLDRQARSKRQRQRPDLRIARGEPRLFAGARSDAQHDQPGEDYCTAIRTRRGSRNR